MINRKRIWTCCTKCSIWSFARGKFEMYTPSPLLLTTFTMKFRNIFFFFLSTLLYISKLSFSFIFLVWMNQHPIWILCPSTLTTDATHASLANNMCCRWSTPVLGIHATTSNLHHSRPASLSSHPISLSFSKKF